MPNPLTGSVTPNTQAAPLLVPNSDTPYMHGGPGLGPPITQLETAGQLLSEGIFGASITPAMLTVTLTGAGTAGDAITVQVVSCGAPGLTAVPATAGLTVATKVPASPTVTLTATAIVTAINAALSRYLTASSAAGVITLKAARAGVLGNYMAVLIKTANATDSGGVLNVLSPLAGGNGDIITALDSVAVQLGREVVTLRPGRPTLASVQLINALSGSLLPIV